MSRNYVKTINYNILSLYNFELNNEFIAYCIGSIY